MDANITQTSLSDDVVFRFDSSLLAIEAAISGQGVVVVPEFLVEADLRCDCNLIIETGTARDPHQIFPGAVFGNLSGHDLGDFDGEVLGQKGAVILGKIGHLREIAHAPVMQPLSPSSTELCPHWAAVQVLIPSAML